MMKLKTLTKVLLSILVLGSLTWTSRADEKVTEGNGVNTTMENDAIKVNIAVEGGGRINSLIDKFYFWQGSKIFPTYEWVYPDVSGGKSISMNYALQLINTPNPDWKALGAKR